MRVAINILSYCRTARMHGSVLVQLPLAPIQPTTDVPAKLH